MDWTRPSKLERKERLRPFLVVLRRHQSLLRLLRQLKDYAPQAHILGHRDLSPDRNSDGRIAPEEWLKSCPCLEAETEYHTLNDL